MFLGADSHAQFLWLKARNSSQFSNNIAMGSDYYFSHLLVHFKSLEKIDFYSGLSFAEKLEVIVIHKGQNEEQKFCRKSLLNFYQVTRSYGHSYSNQLQLARPKDFRRIVIKGPMGYGAQMNV